jgi:hypothetical protein
VTLVLTAANDRFVVQVSDRRLSYPTTGETYDDEANKAVVLVCQTAKLAISYTGLGCIGTQRTDEWLVDVLMNGGAGQKEMPEAIQLLTESATAAFAGLGIPLERKRHVFVLAGWYLTEAGTPSPIVWCVSNCLGPGPRWAMLPTVKPVFEARFLRARQGTGPRGFRAFFVHGYQSAFHEACRRRVKNVRKALTVGGPEGVVAMLVSLVRAAAQHPLGERRVGRSCMSVVIASDFSAVTHYHPAGGHKPQIYMPHVVGAHRAWKNIEVWVGQRPPWWTHSP